MKELLTLLLFSILSFVTQVTQAQKLKSDKTDIYVFTADYLGNRNGETSEHEINKLDSLFKKDESIFLLFGFFGYHTFTNEIKNKGTRPFFSREEIIEVYAEAIFCYPIVVAELSKSGIIKSLRASFSCSTDKWVNIDQKKFKFKKMKKYFEESRKYGWKLRNYNKRPKVHRYWKKENFV